MANISHISILKIISYLLRWYNMHNAGAEHRSAAYSVCSYPFNPLCSSLNSYAYEQNDATRSHEY